MLNSSGDMIPLIFELIQTLSMSAFQICKHCWVSSQLNYWCLFKEFWHFITLPPQSYGKNMKLVPKVLKAVIAECLCKNICRLMCNRNDAHFNFILSHNVCNTRNSPKNFKRNLEWNLITLILLPISNKVDVVHK